VHLDINGGEPSASKNYKNILANLPSNVKSVRINTNCSLVIPEIQSLLDQGVEVVVTVSLDGIGPIHDYVRWPIKWEKFYTNLMSYQSMGLTQLNTWTTVSALNIGDLENIFNFVKSNSLLHSWAFLNTPDALNVEYKNSFTEPYNYMFPAKVAIQRNNQDELDSYLARQHKLRGIQ
jgi:sulfatase maturation enzyme AslB (radical SAM superfamily)